MTQVRQGLALDLMRIETGWRLVVCCLKKVSFMDQ